MTNIPPPVNPDDRPKEWIEVHRLESDKRGKDEPPPEPPRSKIYLLMHFILKKVLPFISSEDSKKAAFDVSQLVLDLTSIKKLLETLKNEDQSHNPHLATNLSEEWHHLAEDFRANKAQFIAQLPGAAHNIELFISKVSAYPPSEDLNLGYYLKEYVGKEWLPFPFMDILHQLHEEQKTLQEWIQMLDQIISSTQP